jgi:hypothetical protein
VKETDMKLITRFASSLIVCAALASAGAAAAADELELLSLSPASGAMAPGAMVTATLRYRLESAASGKIGTYTLGAPGNPAHISIETPVFVQKGKGTVKTTFGVKCDPQYPGPIHIKNLRYVLFAEAPGGPITATLVEKFRGVKFTWTCPKEGGRTPHRVIGAKLEADPPRYKGPCPVTIKFHGSIETDGPATVKYIFKRSDNAIDTNDRHFTLAAAPFHQAVNTTWTLGGPGMVYNGWEQIYIETPNAGFTSNQAHFHIACDGAPGNEPGGHPAGEGKPDITSKKGITIGTVFIPWGGNGTLKAAEAIQSSPNNACAFNATYDMVNVGSVATSPAFLNRLKVDATSVVAINSGLSLNAGETKNITTQPYLPIGTHRLTLALDDDHNVAESDESPASNVKTVSYTLQGPCGPPKNLPGVAVPKR